MKHPTNEQVKKALNNCINKRWMKIVKNDGQMDWSLPLCHLCDLFLNTPKRCSACPLHIYETTVLGRTGHCKGTTAYGQWSMSYRGFGDEVEAAQHVLQTLKDTQEHFFRK